MDGSDTGDGTSLDGDPDSWTEIVRLLDQLESLGLASRLPLVMEWGSIFPPPGSGWLSSRLPDGQLVFISEPLAKAADDGTVKELMAAAELWRRKAKRDTRLSGWRGVAEFTLFLPVTLITAIPFPTHPGSLYTVGQLITGGLAFLSIPGFFFGVFTRNWVLGGLCLYWWLGARFLQSELTRRGYYPPD